MTMRERPQTMGTAILRKIKSKAAALKLEIFVLYLSARDPRTPWLAKLLVAGIVAYALSPIDLIPDFIPVLGYLDDLILLPLGIAWAIHMIPPAVMAECRARAQGGSNEKPVSRLAAAVIVLVWLALAVLLTVWIYRAWPGLRRVGR